jgi:hypothetical protein
LTSRGIFGNEGRGKSGIFITEKFIEGNWGIIGIFIDGKLGIVGI